MARIEGEIHIDAPVQRVFDVVADERNEPRYNPRIVRAEKVSDGPVGAGARYLAYPAGAGRRGAMTVETVAYERPSHLVTRVRASYLEVDGAMSFAAEDGGTRMRWSWDTRLRGAARVMTPVLLAVGPRWERRNWVGLKRFLESAPAGS